MNPTLTITKIPTFNSVVIKQHGGRHFISAPNSIVIGKEAYITILTGLIEFGFLEEMDLIRIVLRMGKSKALSESMLHEIANFITDYNEEERKANADKENIDSPTIGESGSGEDNGIRDFEE